MSDDQLQSDRKVTAFNRRFVGFIAGHPVASILIGLALVAACLPGLPKVRADFTHTGFFWDNDPKLLQFEDFERRFGNDDSVLLVVHSPSGVFDMDTAGLVIELTEKMWQVPEVIRVDSLANFNWVHARGDDIAIEPLFPKVLTPEILTERGRIALAHETLPNYLISKDGQTTIVVARIKPGLDRAPDAKAISLAMRKLAVQARRGDHVIHIGGGPVVTYAFEEVSQADLLRLVPLVVALSALFLVGLLRSFVGTVLPFALVFLSTLAAFGFAGLTGLVQSTISTAVPTILIAIGIADTVHILVIHIAALRRGMSRREAAHHALTHNLLATFLTSLTTAVGFFSFVSANLKPISVLGVMAGFGTMMCWLLSQLFVGGLLFILPIKVKPASPEHLAATDRRAGWLVDLVVRRRWFIIGTTAVLSAISLWISYGIDVNSDPIKYFTKKEPVRAANEFLEREMGNARSIELVVEAGREDGIKDPAFLGRVDAFQKWLEAQPGITRVVSLVDVLKQMNRALNGDRPDAYKLGADTNTIAQELLLYTMGLPQGLDVNDRVTVKNDALRLTVLNTITTSRESVAAVEAMRRKGSELGLAVTATGKYYLYQQTNDYVVQSFLTSLWSATLIIGAIMALFLRSVKLGIISMIPNVVPLFAGGVLLRILHQPLDMGTVLVSSICLGISIDDTSHVLANFAYLRRQGVAPEAAMKEVMAHSGAALLSTNGILIASFASFATATFVPNFYFGILTAFILAVALLADMFFTPALLLARTRQVRRA